MFSEIRGLGLLLGCVLQTEFAGKAKLIAEGKSGKSRRDGTHCRWRRGAFCASVKM